MRQVALAHNALLVDHWAMREYTHPRMWEPDRLHMSRHGHRYLATAVLRTLDVDHTITLRDLGSIPERTVREALVDEWDWWNGWVRPALGRRWRHTPEGHGLTPKWPQPIRPAEGMKKAARHAAVSG